MEKERVDEKWVERLRGREDGGELRRGVVWKGESRRRMRWKAP